MMSINVKGKYMMSINVKGKYMMSINVKGKYMHVLLILKRLLTVSGCHLHL
jgi:hypothetical protein